MTKTQNDFIKEVKKLSPGKEVITALKNIDRSIFFDPFFKDKINNLAPIPIGLGEYSDDVSLLTRMISILKPEKNWKILEVGTGSGYSTAILSSMCSQIVSVDYHEELASEAKNRLLNNGIFNVKFLAGDCDELDDRAGIFDGAIIHAGCMHSPYSVLNLLDEGGVAVFPMGPAHMQQLTLYSNTAGVTDPFKRYKFFETCNCSMIRGEYGQAGKNMEVVIEKGKEG